MADRLFLLLPLGIEIEMFSKFMTQKLIYINYQNNRCVLMSVFCWVYHVYDVSLRTVNTTGLETTVKSVRVVSLVTTLWMDKPSPVTPAPVLYKWPPTSQ